jgi:hypothetical protein
MLISKEQYIMFDTSERYQMDEADGVIYLIMPYRKQWFQIISLLIGISAGGCIMIPVIYYLFISGLANALNKEQPVALIFPFMILLILLIFSFLEIIWQLTGKEIITISDESIHIRHQIHGFGVTNKFPEAIISGIYVSRQTDLWQTFWTRRSSSFWNYRRGRISINCGRTFLGEAQTYRFGSILDEEGSNHIVEIILKRFPRYEHPPSNKG